MSNAWDRVEAIKKAALPQRLSAGAAHLANFWRAGTRCKSGWGSTCNCGLDQNGFCRTKLKWIGILMEFHDGLPYGLTGTEEFFVIEAMSLSAIKASGLTILVEVPGARKPLRLGGENEIWNILNELEAMDENDRPMFLETVVLMQEKL